MTNRTIICINCDQSEDTNLLFLFKYQDKKYSISPQDLSTPSHQPVLFAHKLPDLELFKSFASHS